jgi:hypothetical protein
MENLMPNLNAAELKQFDDYSALIGDALARTQTLLATKAPAERVPLEIQLSNSMAEFTAINRDAPNAQALHEAPNGNSIYMHEFAGKDDQWEQAQKRIAEISEERGLDAGAVSARLEAGAPNQFVEEMWMQDDLRRMGVATSLNLDDPVERQEAIMDLTSAYQELREDLVAAHVLHPVPQLEAGYQDEHSSPTLTASDGLEIEEKFKHQEWDADYKYSENPELYDQSVDRIEAFKPKVTEFAGRSPEHATLVSELWDRHAGENGTFVGYLHEDERERELVMNTDVLQTAEKDAFAELRERSSEAYSLTRTGAECQEVMSLLRENTSDAQFTRLRQGDLSAIEHITKDPVFSRQLLAEVELENQDKGYQLTREQEERMTESREFLANAFASERDNDYENER